MRARQRPSEGNACEVLSDEDRSIERYRRVGLAAASALFLKGTSLIINVVSVPLTLGYLGKERYGLWMTITAAASMLTFADLGMGNGLLNKISEANGKDDRELAARYVSSGFFILAFVAAALSCVFLLSYSFVPWPQLFNLSSESAKAEAGPSVAAFVLVTIISVPTCLVQRVQIGYQDTFRSNLWQIVGSIMSLVALIAAVKFHCSLVILVLAVSGIPLAVTAASWITVFGKDYPWLRPKWDDYRREYAISLAKTGVIFVVLQVMAVLTVASDNMIVAQKMGPSAVAEYSVAQKLFMFALMPQVFIAPLWPAFGEAVARKDHRWARKTLMRAIVASLFLCGLIGSVLLIFSRQLLSVWIGSAVTLDRSLLSAFFFASLIGCYGGVMSTFFSSGPLLKKQAVFYSVATFCALTLKIVLVGIWGVSGVVWATVIAFGALYVWPAWILARRFLNPTTANI